MTTSIKSCYFLSSESICIGSSNKTCSASTKRLAFAPKIGKLFSYFLQKLPHRLLEKQLIALLQSCRTKKQLHQIHAQVFCHGLERNHYVAPKIITTCAQLKEMGHAHKAFDHILDPNVSLWNAMFRGYSQNELNREVVRLFSQMRSMGVMPNCFTFPVVLKSCGKINALMEGQEVHCFVMKSGFKDDPFVGTTLIEMYSTGGKAGTAYKAFGEMLERNVVAWTLMIHGYISCGDVGSARHLFDMAPERDIVLWNTMISGYIKAGDMAAARELFNAMPNRDVMSWNTMLNGYANNGDLDACEMMFEEMPERNIFSWNGLIGGYALNGNFLRVLATFKRMLIEGTVSPNDATLMTVLSACGRLGSLDLGKWVHVYAESHGYGGNTYVVNALIDMYAKCGTVENALYVFVNMSTKDLISWNTVINGLAIHGRGADALSLFEQMKRAGVKPDGITFIGVLCACTHMGMVADGFSHFQSMIDDYSLVPRMEHYGCMVDLLARAGLLVQAVEFVNKMPVKADAVIWATLLGACRLHKNVDLAEVALHQLNELEPGNPTNYVTLSNIYRDVGKWKDVARLKAAMKDTGRRKLPGCSLIEVNDDIVEFYSLDERHPDGHEIYEALDGLIKLSRSSGYESDLTSFEQ
ncbi:pentatricopeptide repeat-containing protein At3g29230-like [Eucalyptus grandis]|uniref:pentatricopeptide repeat-containing protein At3g29230-like n=1 Tax=Eucalyptus grandis TaxID=71139 RepID=UPI00192EF832|nr:pentatricopeptide repeat-containing protein At3g29230-like [Eucalyptus grandis]